MENLCNDVNMEKAVISVLLGYPSAFEESVDYLRKEYFTDAKCMKIYNAVKATYEAGNGIDLLTVSAYFMQNPKEGVQPYELAELSNEIKSDIHFEQYCRRLSDLYERRKLWLIGQQLIKAGTSEVENIDELKAKSVEAIQALDDSDQTNIQSIGEAFRDLSEIVNNNLNGTRICGAPTGFEYLDAKGGLQPCDLVVIAAEFSQGKTSLALDFAVNAARNDYPVAFYSTEMQGKQLAARMVAADSGLSSRVIMQNKLTDAEVAIFDKSGGKFIRLPFYFDDRSTLSVERIISSIRTMKRKRGVKVVFIDYLQVLQTNEKSLSRTEEQFFGATCRKLKNLAKELEICIVLLSQISRSKDNTEPTLSRLRGSGQIAEAADVVLLIYRPEFYGKRYSGDFANVDPKGTAQITISKGRNIGTGAFICGFKSPTTHFYPLDVRNVQAGNDSPF